PIAFDDAVEILEQICGALEATHARGIIHRDLKPENVFLADVAETRVVKLLDFGIAKLTGDTSDSGIATTRTGTLMGTPFYCSPEQARGRKVDARTDIYSLSVLTFEMLTGELPFDADNVADVVSMHLHQAPPAPKSRVPAVPEPLDALVLAMMAKDQTAR